MVDETHIEDLESFLSQSLIGFHHLFDAEKIKDILQVPTEDLDFFNLENMEEVQGLITKLMSKPSLDEKRRFLESLNKDRYEKVLRAYFHIVDSTLLAAPSSKH